MVTTVSLSDKAHLIRGLTLSLPKNAIGLLEGIYRADLLDPSIDYFYNASSTPLDASTGETDSSLAVTPETIDGRHEESEVSSTLEHSPGVATNDEAKAIVVKRYLETAFVPIAYIEGFPTLPDGNPFWSRFNFEPGDAFTAFEVYLKQGNFGARQLFMLKPINGHSLQQYQDFFHIYYWEARARSYDLFKVAAFSKLQEARALELQDDHYIKSKTLLAKCYTYMESEDFMDLLTPKAAIDLLKTLTQLQRVSVGLNAAGPLQTAQPAAPGASIEVILRNIVSQQGADSGHLIDATTDEEDAQVNFQKALSDPETAAMAQELVIKLNTTTKPAV